MIRSEKKGKSHFDVYARSQVGKLRNGRKADDGRRPAEVAEDVVLSVGVFEHPDR